MTAIEEHNMLVNNAINSLLGNIRVHYDCKTLARFAGITQTQLEELRKNEMAWSFPTILRLCNGLGCTIDEMFEKGKTPDKRFEPDDSWMI